MYTDWSFYPEYTPCYESPSQSQVSLTSCSKGLLANMTIWVTEFKAAH